MPLLQRLNNFRSRKNVLSDNVTTPISQLQQQYTLPGLLARSAYDNGFAPISAISDEILKRNLRLGDVNNIENDVTSQYPFWYAVVRPNDRMGFTQFIDLLVAGFLSLDEFSLLVWHTTDGQPVAGAPVGGFSYDNIAGFTVLQNKSKQFDSQGREYWEQLGVGGTQKFYREDVITLKYSVLPDDGYSGVSPGSASGQEAAVQDRMNQQIRATFDNGATPSLIVTIHARSHEEAETIQRSYEKNNRGAAKAGGVVYQTVIDNAMLQGMGEPKIVITPVGMTNDNLAITEIADYTKANITANYAVSPIIYGDATTTTFQNQELANSKFMGRVQSIMVRLFASFEHEISRITNTILPFKFVWDDTDIELTEEQQVKAQTKTELVRAYLALVGSGASPSQVAEVLQLDDSWKKLDVTVPVVALDSPREVNILEHKCEHHNSIERVSELESQAQKKIVELLKQASRDLFDGKTINATASNSQIDKQIVAELVKVMEKGSFKAGQELLDKLDTGRPLADFANLKEASLLALEKRGRRVLQNYVEFVSERLNSLDVDDPLRQTFVRFYNSEVNSKVSTIAQQEIKKAYQSGELNVAENIQGWLNQNEPLSSIVKVWRTTSDMPCEFCVAMDGVQAGIEDSFVPGGLIDSGDTVLKLDTSYSDGSTPDAHVNCQCVYEFDLVSK